MGEQGAETDRPAGNAPRCGPDDPTLAPAVPIPDVPTLPGYPGPPPPLGPAIPGYEILGELGRGGIGVVYRARHERLGRVVALKMLLAGGHAGEDELRRFRAEAEAVAALQHANIVQIYESGEADGKPFFSLEFCGGGNLAHRLDGTPWPAERAAGLLATLARAVHAAHRRGVVHRDLKPANILLTEDDTLKVSDFGLAKRLDHAGVTRTGDVMGTPSYMAPEQAGDGKHPIGPATDVWALGAILYELLTGRPPFKAATPLDTILQVIAEDPVPPSRLVRGLPRDLETVCLSCLNKDPRRRYASAEALADDLGRFLRGEPVSARRLGVWERALRWARRRPAAASALAVGVAAAAALLASGLVYHARLRAALEEARRAEADAAREHDRAEANLQRALEGADRMVGHAGERLANRPGVSDVRQQLLEEALEFNRGFLQTESRVPAVRRETARAEYRTATVDLMLGRRAEAEKASLEARRLQEELVAEFPDQSNYRHDLCRTLACLGHVYSSAGRFDEGLASYNAAVALNERLVEEHPENPGYLETLVGNLNSRGFFYSFAEPQKAEADFRRAVAIAQRRAASGGDVRDEPCVLAAAYTSLATILLRTGRMKEAGELLEKAHALLEPPDRPAPRGAKDYRSTLATNQVYLGLWYIRTGRPGPAERPLREGMAYFETMVAENPRSVVSRISLSLCYPLLAGLCLKSGRPEEANAFWQKAIELNDQIARDYPVFRWGPQADRVRAQRLAFLSQQGKAVALLSEAEALAAKPELSGDTWYNLACVYALAAVQTGDAAATDGHRRRAMALLAKAETAGYFRSPQAVEDMRKDEDLRSLRGRKDFEELLGRLGKGAGGP
jgi:serine/threonine-protein kinase